ncbi:bifunctional 5,10-methylenetetrahydrofolate dehydrogenase/5,10-methenyltetrahydrofolate cyclohydrolase [Candidatus Bipolaricaulota bacterium]|nr:bifunctional 5,10-methylenetetrahydrofolate dehydrogenase/5,10-methenyltetrahydrofolate cyclohydrolase [Candidatus Bipolaricaulota bacterium]
MNTRSTEHGARVLSGASVAEAIRARIVRDIAGLRAHGVTPTMAVVRSGGDKAAAAYAGSIRRTAEKVGIAVVEVELPPDALPEHGLQAIRECSAAAHVHGVLPIEPLPLSPDPLSLALAVPPEKDVDGVHPKNLGALLAGGAGRATYHDLQARDDVFLPATAEAAMEILLAYGIEVSGREAVVVGAGRVGLPLAVLLLREGATPVILCRRATADLATITRRADLLCVAAGRPRLITADMVKPGATVIDIGINAAPDGVTGDVDFAGVRAVAGAITPVPGGVGPVTVALLLAHTVRAARAAARERSTHK